MIYTVTLNPSLDFLSSVDSLEAGRTNYSTFDTMNAGGRAINISRILNKLDIPSTATGFVGGKTGEFIEEALTSEGICHNFIHTEKNTRINLSIFHKSIETRIIGTGADINIKEINTLMYYLSRIREGDFLIIAGSLPGNMSSDVYNRMIEIARVNGAEFIPVVSKEFLIDMLPKKPLLIAPTLSELSDMLEEDLRTEKDIIGGAMQCLYMGAQNVLVNMGLDGSIFLTSKKMAFRSKGPEGKIVSETYTGIALVAGFVSDYMRLNDPEAAFSAAQAVSNATYKEKSLPEVNYIYDEQKRDLVIPLN